MARYPGATWRPLTGSKGTNWRSGRARRIAGQPLVFVGHSAVTNEASLFNLFNNPARKASSHFYVKKDGSVEQYVDTNDTAFTNGCGRDTYLTPLARKLCGSGNNANDNSITCELQGGVYSPTHGYSEPMTQAQFFATVKLMRWVRETHNTGTLVLGTNVAEHNWFAPTACPSHRYAWHLLIPAANGAAPPPPPPGPPTFDEVMKVLGFKDPCKFGAWLLETSARRDGLLYLFKNTGLSGDAAWAWAITQRFNADYGKPYDTSWDA